MNAIKRARGKAYLDWRNSGSQRRSARAPILASVEDRSDSIPEGQIRGRIALGKRGKMGWAKV